MREGGGGLADGGEARQLALPATSGNLARVEEFKRLANARNEAARKSARTTADQLGNVSVKITRAVGEENKMYGSVTSRDIEEAFAAQGVELDRKTFAEVAGTSRSSSRNPLDPNASLSHCTNASAPAASKPRAITRSTRSDPMRSV